MRRRLLSPCNPAFRNASGDPSVDWLGSSLADMLSTDVGQSAHLRTVSPERLHQILSDLRIAPGTSLDPNTISRIAQFSNATRVWDNTPDTAVKFELTRPCEI